MPIREITPEELRQLESPEQRMAGGLREITPEELAAIEAEEGATELPGREGLTQRVVKRMLGTDVKDPLELERLGAVVVGASAGAFAGSRVPVAPGLAGVAINPITGALTGGLAGAVSGAVAPEMTMEAAEFLGLIPEGTREAEGLSPDELARVASGEALLELATGGTVAGLRATGRAVGRFATGVGRAEQQLAEEAAGAGVVLAPFQVGEKGLGRGIVNVLGRFPWIGSGARAVGEASEESFKRVSQAVPTRIAPLLSTSELGVKLVDNALNLVKEYGGRFERKYGELFLRAKRAGALVQPKETTGAVAGVLEEVGERATAKVEGKGTPALAGAAVEKFLNKNFVGLADQSLAQADEMITKIDQFIAKSKRGVRKEVAALLAPVRGAIKNDIRYNMTGPGSAEIGRQMGALDTEFSNVMNFLFETSTAKRFETVERQGLRGMATRSERATRMPVDKVAETIIDLDSPQAIDELARMLPRQTFKEVASKSLANIFDRSIQETAQGGTKLNADRLALELGLKGTDTTRQRVVNRLLIGTGLTSKELKTIVDAAQKVAGTPIPNWSTFIARRAMIGGAASMLRGLLPFAAFTAGSGAATGPVGAVIGGLLFLGGGKALVGAVSNPLSARSFKTVMSKEVGAAAKRAAFLRLARFGIQATQEAGEMTVEQVGQLLESSKDVARELFPPELRSAE